MKKLVLFIIFIAGLGFAQTNKSGSISNEQFEKLVSDTSVVILDVRTPAELSGPLGKIDRAVNIPVQQLASRVNELKPYKDKEIIIICRTQNRSRAAADIISKSGYKAKYVIGGMSEYRAND